MKKIEAIYIGTVPIFVYGQGVIKKGETIFANERDLEREDIIRIIRIKKIKINKIKKIQKIKKIKIKKINKIKKIQKIKKEKKK